MEVSCRSPTMSNPGNLSIPSKTRHRAGWLPAVSTVILLVGVSTRLAADEAPRAAVDGAKQQGLGTETGFVSARDGEFWLWGAPFRFVGANLRGMVHYGEGDVLPYSLPTDRQTNCNALANEMNGRVARVFVSCKFADRWETGNRLQATLAVAETYGIYLIVAFTDMYSASQMFPMGDEGYYTAQGGGYSMLNHQFFSGGYTDNYLPQVEYLVDRFQNAPAIFAWELGNEIRDLSDPATFVSFCQSVHDAIRAIDVNHMIAVGCSRYMAGLSWSQAVDLYTDRFDFLVTHTYDGSDLEDESALASTVGKPFIVEEAGFNSNIFPDRPSQTDADIAKWTGRNASGYLQWGLMATSFDNGDGDWFYGVDHVLHGDWNAYMQVYSSWGSQLTDRPLVRPQPGTLIFQNGREFPDHTIYTSAGDAHIIQNHPLYNTGGDPVLEACRYDGSDNTHDRSIVIRFAQLDTSLEAGKYLHRAVLTLEYFGTRNDPGGVQKTLYIHKLLHDWGEGTKTGIEGAWAGAGEVCWTKPFGATGGDNPNWNGTLDALYADPDPLDSVTLGGAEDYGTVSFTVTEAVRDHLNEPAQNFGFVIREEPGQENPEDGTRQFHSCQADLLEERPALTLTFGDEPLPAGDLDGDSDVDLDDYARFDACYTGSGGGVSLPCRAADLDGDNDVDLIDLATFQASYTGTS